MKKYMLFAVLFLCFKITVSAQTSAITTTSAVNDVVNNLKTQVEDLSYSLEGIISRQTFDMRQHLLVISNNLDFVLEKNIDKTFYQLTKTQQQLLTDIEFLLADLQKPINQTIQKFELLTDKANSFAASLPGGKKATLLSNFSPKYYLQGNQKELKIIVQGSWLSSGNPHILYKNSKIYPTTKLDSKLEFIIPDMEVDSLNAKLNIIPLIVYQKKFLGKKKLNYKVGINSIPNLMADYKLEVTTSKIDTLRQSFSQELNHRNDHCQGARDVILTVTANSGYKIDKNSIKHSGDVRENCSYNGLRSVTENGYQVTAVARNSGSCRRVLGQIVSYDARGSVKLKTSYTEYKVVEVINDDKIEIIGKGYWNNDFIFKLPENTKSFVLTITKINGEKIIVTNSKNDNWMKIKYDQISNSIIISPNKIEDAL